MSKESYHKVCLGDKHALPTCTGKDWKKFLMPCKHFLAIFEHAQGVSWNSLSEIYTSSPFFTTDVYVFGIREPVALDIENTEDPLLGSSSLHNETSKENFEKNKMERNVSKFEELTVKKEKVKLDFSCREIMKEIKSLSYIIDNRDALENLKQRLTGARDEFAHYAPTDHGLVVESSKEKVKLEKSLKRKPMENLPMPKIRKSKFTGRVGVANEAKRFASNIYVSEKRRSNASNIETSQVPLCEQYHPVSEIYRKQATCDIDVDHAVAVTNTIQETNLNYTITSKIITQLPSIPFSTSLLRNGCHSLTYLDLLSLECVHSTSQLEKIQKYDSRFRTGWLHDEIFNLFLYMMTKKNRSTLYCRSTAALVVAERKSFRKLWKNEDLFSKSFIFISCNPNNSHWILVVVNISERTIGVLDPLTTDTHWTDTSVQRRYRIGLNLMQMKFGLTNVKRVNIRHVKQPDNSSCGVLVCYYAEQMINGNVFL